MSSNNHDSIQFAIQEVNIYIGLTALVIGLLGNILNIIIFLSLKTFRETSCAFYLTSASAVSIAQLLSSLMSRVIISGYFIDLTQASLFLCKFRFYIWINCCLLWLTFLCCATVDQFASLTDRWRHLCSIPVARRVVIVALVFWCLHGIPLALLTNTPLSSVTGQLTCVITNPTYAVYHSRFVFPILLGLLPIVIRITFGLLSFLRARSLANRQVPLVRSERDKQLTSMVLVEIVVDVLLTLPYIIYYIYYANTVFVDPVSGARALLIYTVLVLFYYSSGAASFYIYCCSSSRFRKQFIHVLCLKGYHQRPNQLQENQVAPQPAHNDGTLSIIVNIKL